MEKIGQFQHKIMLANKTFDGTEEQDLTIHIYMNKGQVYFQVTVPKHIYDKVVGTEQKYIKSYLQKSNISPVLDKKIKFKQKIMNDSFHKLVTELEDISHDAIIIETLKHAQKRKVIFVKFTTTTNDEKDDYNFATLGKKINISFQYFVCFRKKVDSFWRYGRDIKYINEGLEPDENGFLKQYWTDPKEKGFQLIKWTQEREDFLHDIQEGFIKLNNKLAQYLADLDEKKLDVLISRKIQLLESRNE